MAGGSAGLPLAKGFGWLVVSRRTILSILTIMLITSILAGLPGCSGELSGTTSSKIYSSASDATTVPPQATISQVQALATDPAVANAMQPDVEQTGKPGDLAEGKYVTLRDQYPVSPAYVEAIRMFSAKTAAALLTRSDQNSCFHR